MNMLRLVVVSLALLLAVQRSFAQAGTYSIRQEDVSNGHITTNTFNEGSGPHSIALNSATRYVKITTSSSGVNVDALTLSGGPTNATVRISLGSTFDDPNVEPSAIGNNWAGMDATALFDSAFYGRIGGNLTNSLKIDRLNRFQANGSINALVDAQYGGNDFYGCYVVAGSISSSGHV